MLPTFKSTPEWEGAEEVTLRCWGPADHRGFILVSSVTRDQTRFLSLGVIIILGWAILCGGPPWALPGHWGWGVLSNNCG